MDIPKFTLGNFLLCSWIFYFFLSLFPQQSLETSTKHASDTQLRRQHIPVKLSDQSLLRILTYIKNYDIEDYETMKNVWISAALLWVWGYKNS